MKNNIIEEVSKNLNIEYDIVNKIYMLYWKYIKETISNLNIKNNIKEEEFNKLKTNFNLYKLGKLYCTYNKIVGINKKNTYLKNKKNDKYKEN